MQHYTCRQAALLADSRATRLTSKLPISLYSPLHLARQTLSVQNSRSKGETALDHLDGRKSSDKGRHDLEDSTVYQNTPFSFLQRIRIRVRVHVQTNQEFNLITKSE